MPGFWQIVTPQAGQNLVTNPSVEIDLTGYSANDGAALFRNPGLQRRGLYGLGVTTSSGAYDGILYAIALTAGHTYTFSLDFWGTSGRSYLIGFGFSTSYFQSSFTGLGYWHPNRPSYTITAGSTGIWSLMVIKNNDPDTVSFWVDGFQCEESGSPTTYIDGDQPGCSWDGAWQASTSTRDGQSRAGGVLHNFDEYAMAIEQIAGVGMPEVENVIIRYGLQDGGYYQRTKALPRVFQLSGAVNNAPLQSGASLNTYHANRKALIDALKIDLVDSMQPFYLRYDNGANKRPLWIKALYQAGMETNYFGGGGFTEQMGDGFIAPDPLWYEEGNCATSLGYQQSVANANYILERTVGGVWQALSTGMNDTVYCMAIGPDNALYAGGSFTTAGGVTVNNIAKWNGTAWVALNNGVNGGVSALAFDAAGNLYAAGFFTTAGSPPVTVNRIAKWNGTTWTALNNGLNSWANALAFGPGGDLYVGGIFTTAGSPAVTVNHVAKWNGSVWSALNNGTNDEVYDLAVGPNGNLYAAGTFTTAGSPTITANLVAMWDGSWHNLNVGLTGSGVPYARCMRIGPDGSLYVGGLFTSAGSPPLTVQNIARWNGTAWSTLNSNFNNGVFSMFYGPDNLLYVGGDFTIAGYGSLPDHFAVWTGSVWGPPDINLPGTSTVWGMIFDRAKNFYIGYSTSGSATSSIISVSNNAGTKAAPIFYIVGPGQLWCITNYTTGRKIYFTNLTLLAGELVRLDLTPGNISFMSTWRGNILYTIAPGSDLANFTLLPGNNNISVYIYGSTSANTSAYCLWKNTYWSIDGGAN